MVGTKVGAMRAGRPQVHRAPPTTLLRPRQQASASQERVLDLQRTAGNRAVVQMLAQAPPVVTSLREELGSLRSVSESLMASGHTADKAVGPNTAARDKTMGEQRGVARDELVTKIAALRKRIDDLSAGDAGVAAGELGGVKAGLYRELNAVSPFYQQRANANLVHKAGTLAGERTCNMTSLSMTLEALGVSVSDYADADILATIPLVLGHQAAAMAEARDIVSNELAGLRLPDFLQLVAIASFFKPPADNTHEAHAAALDAARTAAAAKVTFSSFFDTVTAGFGVRSTERWPFQGRNTNGADWASVITRIGVVNHEELPKALKRELAAKRARAKAEHDAAEKAKKQADKKHKIKKFQSSSVSLDAVDRAEAAAGVAAALDKKDRDAASAATAKADAIRAAWAARASLDAQVSQHEAARIRLGDDGKPMKKKGKPVLHPKTAAQAEVEAAIKTANKTLAGLGVRPAKAATADRLAEAYDRQAAGAKALLATGVSSMASDPAALEGILPLADYQGVLLAELGGHLSAGKQVVGHMEGHYIRLEWVDAEGIVVDDPYTGANKRYSWTQARADGFFSRYVLVEK